MSWKDKIRDAECELCPLHEEAEHVCLMGSGKKGARVMFIGEAPGRREDEEHAAFVGASGQYLDELLKVAGLTRDSVYISNVAKCRPPDNRTPKRSEITTCVDAYLLREIEKVDPEILVLLGNAALQGVLGKSGIVKHRGTVTQFMGRVVLPTLHPAAGLRNPFRKPEIQADFRALRRLLSGDEQDSTGTATKVRIIRRSKQLQALRKVLLNADEIAFDLETYTFDNGVRLKGKKVTSGLQEWRGELSVISCISIAWAPGETAVVPLHHETTPWKSPESVLRYLKPALERDDCKYIAHNGKFDCRWLAAKGVFVPLTFDTMLAAHMLDENRSKGLKQLSQVILDADAYDIGEDVKDAYHTPLKRLCVYAAKDADYTLRLYHIFREELKEHPRTARIFKLLMMPASNVLTKVERRGTWVDPDRLNTGIEVAEENVEKIKAIMYRYVDEDKRPKLVPDGATKKLTKELAGINFNSPQQVADWLFNDLGLDPIKETKAENGNWSTDESTLLQLAHHSKAVRALLKYRKWAKYVDTYLAPLEVKHRDEHSRIHPTFKLFGTVTGRLSCEEPNLQNIPRNPFLRGVIGAPPGWKLIEADYSQIELRIAAQLANDTNLLRIFHEGRDPHMEMAVLMTSKIVEDITKEERKQAKPVNFGFLYGMGWEKFIEYARDNYEVDFTEEEARHFRELFFRKWPRLRAWHDRQRRVVQRYGYVQSPIGRVRHLPDVRSGDKGVRAEAERQAINSPVQSFASDLMLVSALQLDDRLDPRECFIVGSIHDALLFQVRDSADSIRGSVETIREEMMNPPIGPQFGAELRVPIDVDIEVRQNWAVPLEA